MSDNHYINPYKEWLESVSADEKLLSCWKKLVRTGKSIEEILNGKYKKSLEEVEVEWKSKKKDLKVEYLKIYNQRIDLESKLDAYEYFKTILEKWEDLSDQELEIMEIIEWKDVEEKYRVINENIEIINNKLDEINNKSEETDKEFKRKLREIDKEFKRKLWETVAEEIFGTIYKSIVRNYIPNNKKIIFNCGSNEVKKNGINVPVINIEDEKARRILGEIKKIKGVEYVRRETIYHLQEVASSIYELFKNKNIDNKSDWLDNYYGN